ncbi:MAG: TIGR01244 family sulfur transferase [Pseudomonadota bacterium]
MTEFKSVTETFAVASQLSEQDIAAAYEEGFRTIICNRPDGEEHDQPKIEALKSKAEALGMTFLALPFSGAPSPTIADQQSDLINNAAQPVLAYCRSGTRSIMAWAVSQRGENRRDEILNSAAKAGYDLRGIADIL